MKHKKIILMLLALFLVMPSEAFAAYPSWARTNIDSEGIKITNGYQWNNHMSYPTLKYELRNNAFNVLYQDYIYEANWSVRIDGVDSSKRMMLMRPRSSEGDGRTLAQPADVSWWGGQLNGNPTFVQRKYGSGYTSIKNMVDGTTYRRAYSRDLGEWSGAIIRIAGTGEFDNGPNGNLLQLGRVLYTTTQFPTPTITAPSSTQAGKPITVNFTGKEYYPHSEYSTTPEIHYELKLDGKIIKKGIQYKSSFSDSQVVSSGICTAGTHTFELKLTDRVERSKTTTKTINITGSAADCEEIPGGGENPDPVLPPDVITGSCTTPQSVPPRYEHELDLQLNRIDARTVDLNAETETDLYLKREDFSQTRGQAKNEFDSYISTTNSYKADCQIKISTWESEISKMESGKQTCVAEKRPNCDVYDSAISLYRTQIASGQSMLPTYDQRINQAQNELSNIQNNESTYRTISANVELKHDGTLIANELVPLSEGQSVRKSYTWKVPTQAKDLMGQINNSGPFQEFKYTNLTNRSKVSLGYNSTLGNVLYPNTSSNNWKDTRQYVASYESGVCTPFTNQSGYFQDQKIEGVVRTVNDNWSKRELKEELTTKFTKLPREKMRAGYGFDYEITSYYRNFDSEYKPKAATGTKLMDGYFSSLVSYLPFEQGHSYPEFNLKGIPIPSVGINEGFKVPMQSQNPSTTFNETRKWLLPRIAVEEYSGNTFLFDNNDYLYHPERNLQDTILTADKQGNSLNKWFVPFSEPDGNYPFRVRTYDAGINHLNTCHNGKVLVDGVIIGDANGNDDYVKRAVTPENPFPAGIGWNWNGQVGKLTNLNEWYSNWFNNPTDLSTNDYKKQYYLTPDSMEKIRDYSVENPKPIIGESVTQVIPVDKK